jgi:glycine/D-amino acid oxidase-like deaminating enzyme
MTASMSSDVLIIGGGLAGCALAYNLSRKSARVQLLEAGNLCSGTSAACAGRVQALESETDEYLQLVLNGFKILRDLHIELERNLDWEEPGHMILLRNEQDIAEYQPRLDRMQRHGASAQMLNIQELRQAEPNLLLDGFIAATVSLEGRANPFKVCLGYAAAARRLGACITPECRVMSIQKTGSGMEVHTSNGEVYRTGVLVVAAGAWSGEVLKLAGRHFPMHSTHAEAFVTEPMPVMLHHHVGLTGFYEAVHGNERSVAFGVAQQPHGSLIASNAIQPALHPHRKSTFWGLPAIASAMIKLLPQSRKINIIRSWAAPSPFMPDHKPAIGWLPDSQSLYVTAGFHLALPTIPLLTKLAARQILGEELDPRLVQFTPARFDFV